MDRRSFVAGSALGLAGIAASASLAGAALADAAESSEADAAVATVTSAEGAQPGAGISTPEAAPSWLGEEPQIAESDIAAAYDCDILVIGAGCAGSAAAATAAELGLNCICVERAACVPETREYLCGVNTKYTEGQEAVDTGKLLNEISRYSSGKADRNLVKMFIENSAETIEWVGGYMEAAGKECVIDVPSDHATGGTDYYLPVVQHDWEPSYTYPMRNDLFMQKAAEEGNAVLYNCKMLKLVHDDEGVKGAVCDYEGTTIQINAPYTIVATGGYGANSEMMMALQPDTVHCTTACSYHGLDDGSGIKAGIWAGGSKQADPTPMIFDRGAVVPGQNAGYELCDDGVYRFPGKNYQLNIGSQPFLKVNRNGERFANESTPYDNMLFATRRQPGGVFCQVFDGNCDADIIRFSMIGCASYTTAMVRDAGYTAEEFMSMDGGDGLFVKADTLDELADKLGFEGDAKTTFLATCDRYNELYDAQKDEDFGKEDYRLSELRTAPFYGCWYGASLLGTLDGLNINAKMQVLDADYNVVPGLYAAGDASGSFFYTNYPEYIPGLAACRSVTEGRQCVKMIAESAGLASGGEKTQVEAPAPAPAVADCADGTYTGSAEGVGGTINVTLEIADGKFTVSEIGPNYETPRYPGYFGIEGGTFAEQLEATQSDQIDGITQASITTGAIERAVRDALKQAGK